MDKKNNKPIYKHLVISGGSVRAISHVGALHCLIEKGYIDLKQLKSIAGTSAGALFGCLLTIGFTTNEIWDFLKCLDFNKLVNPDFFLFLKQCGVDSGKIIYNLMEDILTKKTGIKQITFKQLFNLTNINFIVIGSCLTTKEAAYYDYINTPDFQVSLAIRISISMPGFFTPVIIDGKKYVDGGILNNFAMNLFEDKLEETIGILICNEYNTNYKYPEEYFMAIINLFMYNFYKHAEKYPNNTIFIRKEMINQSIFDFNMNYNTKLKLFELGKQATNEFIEKRFNNLS